MSDDRPGIESPASPRAASRPPAIGAFELRAMAAALSQGRWLCAVSLLLWAGALIGVLFAPVGPRLAGTAWLLSLCAGVFQLYYAMRVDFDARLLRALAEPDVGDGGDAAQRLDAALGAMGLQKPGRAGRDWPSRWRGARGLLLRQALWLAIQFALSVVAYWRVWA